MTVGNSSDRCQPALPLVSGLHGAHRGRHDAGGQWRRLGFSAIALLLALAASNPAEGAVSARFDCAKSHPFAGFGINVFPLHGRIAGLERLIRELDVKFVRWGQLADVEEAEIPDRATFRDLIGWIERIEPDRQRQKFEFFERLRSLGLKQLAVAWRPPVKWRVGQTKFLNGRPNKRIAERYVDAYGELIAALLTVLKRNGIVPDSIELLNEPVLKISDKQYARLVDGFLGWRRQVDLTAIRLAGPGTVYTTENVSYLRAVARQGKQLDIVTTHAYDSNQTRKLTSLRALKDDIPAAWDSPILVTEYGIDPRVWFNSAAAAATVPYGVMTAAQTLALYGSGASAAFIWEAQTPPWADQDFWALLDKQDRLRPPALALKTILNPLQIGDSIASQDAPSEETLPIAVFARPSRLVVEIANTAPQAQEYNVTLKNCTAVTPVVLETQKWPAERMITANPLSATELQILLPAETVVSVVTSRE